MIHVTNVVATKKYNQIKMKRKIPGGQRADTAHIYIIPGPRSIFFQRASAVRPQPAEKGNGKFPAADMASGLPAEDTPMQNLFISICTTIISGLSEPIQSSAPDPQIEVGWSAIMASTTEVGVDISMEWMLSMSSQLKSEYGLTWSLILNFVDLIAIKISIHTKSNFEVMSRVNFGWHFWSMRRWTCQQNFDPLGVKILIKFGCPSWSKFGPEFWSISGSDFHQNPDPNFDQFWDHILIKILIKIVIHFGIRFWSNLGSLFRSNFGVKIWSSWDQIFASTCHRHDFDVQSSRWSRLNTNPAASRSVILRGASQLQLRVDPKSRPSGTTNLISRWSDFDIQVGSKKWPQEEQIFQPNLIQKWTPSSTKKLIGRGSNV